MVAANEDKKMAVVVNFLGEDAEALMEGAAEFGRKHKVQGAALVVPKENVEGPKNYRLATETAVTVLICRGKKVKAQHVLAEAPIDEQCIAAIIADTDKMLAEEVEEEEPREKRKPRGGRKKKEKKKEKKEG